MKKILLIAVFLVLANTSFALAQGESTKVPGTLSRQSPIDPGVGQNEIKHVEADGYMKQEKPFWSDDTMIVAAGLAVVLVGALFFVLKNKKSAAENK